MEMPESVIKIANEMAERYNTDIAKAVAKAKYAIKQLDDYDDLVNDLVHNAIQNLIYDARHRSNVQLKNNLGKYGQPPIQVSVDSNSVKQVYRSMYEYNIGKSTLGKLYGKELASLAETESQLSDGHRFNSALLAWLAGIVPDEKRVEEAVPISKLEYNAKRIYREVHGKEVLSEAGH